MSGTSHNCYEYPCKNIVYVLRSYNDKKNTKFDLNKVVCTDHAKTGFDCLIASLSLYDYPCTTTLRKDGCVLAKGSRSVLVLQ